ncbi:MAG: hypothetical protein EHM78_24505 [Myxococcaceae bacterium]|nr:MAG: hypothetical protein EHM78_24505 [Myxococcaceae bacterium]
METADLEKLKSACRDRPTPPGETEAMELGETTWFIGWPAKSPKGTIALTQWENTQLIIREEEVLEAVEDRGRFLVKVRADSHVMLRTEHVFQARPKRQGCTCDSSSAAGLPGDKHVPRTAARPAGQTVPETRDCWIETRCEEFVDERGYVRRVCVPILLCEPIIWT